jgi:hypothetical protein
MCSEISDNLDDLDAALTLVRIEYDAKEKKDDAKEKEELLKILKPHLEILGEKWKPIGALIPLSRVEVYQLESMCDMIERYQRQERHAHPLCLAVFGPPGSGKSFAVAEIQKELKNKSKVWLLRTTINLTQLSSSAELTGALGMVSRADDIVPIILFDEFDTTRNGAPYGWLSSFLAPMHDGEFLHNGVNIELKKAIYVFAGGTASTWNEFISLQSNLEFRRAKGPDFISRLRGYLDVPGPNESPRMFRRALILRSELKKRVKRIGSGKFQVDPELLKAFLQTGRYLHGARSIAALIELIELNPEKPIRREMLPGRPLLAMQVDRGPLDPRAIGGSIALSGFDAGDNTKIEARDFGECWKVVANGLWTEGATLAFAGGLKGHGLDLAQLLIEALSKLPQGLTRDMESDPRFRSFPKESDFKEAEVEAERVSLELADQERRLIQVVHGTYLDKEEQDWGQDCWKTSVIERFRRSLAVSEASVARFIIGGNLDIRDGRPSGVVGETIQSLALRRPIYLAGGFRGVTRDLGVVLGLSSIRTGAIPKSLKNHLGQEKEQGLKEIEDRLRPTLLTSLPVSPDDQAEFLHKHALGGTLWPENGLSPEDNRALFQSDKPEDVRDLTIKGLKCVFKKSPAARLD